MSIDKQRIEAVRVVEALGYNYCSGKWTSPAKLQGVTLLSAEGDALHALLVTRADELAGYTEGSPEESELEAIANAIEAYEAVRWGKIPGGKG
jgi:hypothetical protein